MGSESARTAQRSIFSELCVVGSRSIAKAMYLSCSLPLTASARRLHAFCRDASSESHGDAAAYQTSWHGSGSAWAAPASVSSELNQRASMSRSLPGYIVLLSVQLVLTGTTTS